MAKKIENARVSVNAFEKYYKSFEYAEAEVTVKNGDEQLTFIVKPRVGLAEFAGAVEGIAESCFKGGAYKAWARDFATRNSIITTYTNITLPKNINKCFDLIMNTPVYEAVVSYIDPEHLQRLEVAVDEQIDAMCEQYHSTREYELAQALASLKAIEKRYREILTLCETIAGDDMRALAEQLQGSARNVKDEVAAVRQKIDEAKEENPN